jgi:hypothetical protein
MYGAGEGIYHETGISEILENLTQCLGTCRLGAEQLAPEHQRVPVQSDLEDQGNRLCVGHSQKCS